MLLKFLLHWEVVNQCKGLPKSCIGRSYSNTLRNHNYMPWQQFLDWLGIIRLERTAINVCGLP
uniref:Uncharacterized protein n=1 Tax=Manihot esculenta TaxID=3983 RepID=A0A2C9VJS6_MANES